MINEKSDTDSKISQLTKDLYDWQECGMGLHQPYNMPKYCKCCGRRL